MTSTRDDLEDVVVSDPDRWRDGPPHELFRRLRLPVRLGPAARGSARG